MIGVTIRGYQEAQRAMLKTAAAVKPSGGLGRAVQYMATQAHRVLAANTHVDTGTYRISQSIRRLSAGRWELYIEPSNTNPRTGSQPAIYGLAEEARGGDHAAYRKTYYSANELAGRAAGYLIADLP